MIIFSFILSLFANHLPVMYVQVPQWADDWAVCAVDIPDAKCHWYVMAPDNTFGEGFDWETAPWFDANGLNDVAPMQEVSVLENYRKKMKTYHIYLEGKVLFKDLNDDEFDVIWGRIYKSYFKDDLTYSVVEDEVLDLEPSF